MKVLLPFLLAVTLNGCEQVTDTSGPGSEADAGTNPAINEGPQTDVRGGEPARLALSGIPVGKATLYGLFSEHGKGWAQLDADASTGKVIRKPVLEFSAQTERIPLRKGVYFGYKYWLKIEPDKSRADLRRVLVHPEMTLPDGSRVSRSERSIRKKTTHGIVTAIDGYALSEDYELVEGDWTFQLWYGNDLLVEQSFTTYWPEEAGHIDKDRGEIAASFDG